MLMSSLSSLSLHLKLVGSATGLVLGAGAVLGRAAHLTESGLSGDELSKALVPTWLHKAPELARAQPRLCSDPHAE